MSRSNNLNDTNKIHLCIRAPDIFIHRKYSSYSIWSQNAFRNSLEARCKNLSGKQLDEGVDITIDKIIVDYGNICGKVTYHVYLDNIGPFYSYVAEIRSIEDYKDDGEGMK